MSTTRPHERRAPDAKPGGACVSSPRADGKCGGVGGAGGTAELLTAYEGAPSVESSSRMSSAKYQCQRSAIALEWR